MRRPRALLAGLAALAVVAAACGDDGGSSSYKEPSGTPQKTVTVEAGNLYFKPTELQLPAGVNAITLEGKGGSHDLVFDDNKVPGFRLDVGGDGDTDELKLDVKPGKYTYYCSVPGHRASMHGTLTVTKG